MYKNKNILKKFDRIPFFTIEAYKQVVGAEDDHLPSIRTQLARWVKSGVLYRLKKGVYMTPEFHDRYTNDERFLPAVSAMLLPNSYVSLEFVLQKNGILTDITYPVSCVTTKTARTISNRIGTFDYHHIRAGLYAGFTMREFFGVIYAQASLGKALFDYLYLRPIPRPLRNKQVNLAEELRLDLVVFSAADREAFSGFVERSKSEKMTTVLENFRRTVWQA